LKNWGLPCSEIKGEFMKVLDSGVPNEEMWTGFFDHSKLDT
jgi:hypothetical protein